MRSFIFAHTRSSLPVLGYEFGLSGPKVLVLGGVHGDEIEGVQLAQALLGRFMTDFPFRLQLTLVPQFNLDGIITCQRTNRSGVDLNRNLPTNDWSPQIASSRYHPGPSANSEPENQGLVSWLQTHLPSFVLSLHSWKPLLNVNGACRSEAEAIARFTKYKIEESIGYPTPGCLGTYCGLERDMPTITYEIERGLSVDQIVQYHLPAVVEGLKVHEKRRSL